MLKLWLMPWLLLASNSSLASFPAERLPPSLTLERSKAGRSERIRRVLQHFSTTVLPQDIDDNAHPDDNPRLDSRDDAANVSAHGTARILTGLPLGDLEAILLDPRTKPFSAAGSSHQNRGDFCFREGDYDFSLIDYVRLLFTARSKPGSLSDEAQEVIRDKLLTLRGPAPTRHFQLKCLPPQFTLGDTENHILMMAVAQFLTNQILFEDFPQQAQYDNAHNGFRDYLLRLLHGYFKQHFEEYNSRPYQIFTAQALHILFGYSKDPLIKQSAQVALDYLSLWTSVQSVGLKRFVPFRRQPEYKPNAKADQRQPWLAWQGDGEAERWTLLAGNYTYLTSQDFDRYTNLMLSAAVTNYQIPDVILSLAIEKAGNPYYFVGQHSNFEAYSSGPGYLLSAGGFFDKQAPPVLSGLSFIPRWLRSLLNNILASWTDKQHGWALPSTLIPAAEPSSELEQMLRFEGHPDMKQRQNTCVAPGVMCGTSPSIPKSMLNCAERVGHWTFLALDGKHCPLNYGIYIAVYENLCSSWLCRESSRNGRYGLVDVRSADGEWDNFQDIILANGQELAAEHPITYQSSQGARIELTIIPRRNQRSIRSVLMPDGTQFEYPLDIAQGRRISGSHFDSDHHTLRYSAISQTLQKRLILDWSQQDRPQSFEETWPSP